MCRLFRKFTFIALILSFSCVSCIFQSDGRVAIFDPNAPGYIPDNSFARDLQIEINKVRGNPRAYALDILTPCLSRYQGYLYTDFEGNKIRTEEGKQGMQDCISYLKFLSSKKILSMEKGLCLASQYFTEDHARTGRTGEYTSDGKNFEDIMNIYGRIGSGALIASLVQYGRANVRDIVISVLVSDGDRFRKGREILLGNAYNKVGISIARGQNAHKGSVSAIYLAESYSSY